MGMWVDEDTVRWQGGVKAKNTSSWWSHKRAIKVKIKKKKKKTGPRYNFVRLSAPGKMRFFWSRAALWPPIPRSPMSSAPPRARARVCTVGGRARVVIRPAWYSLCLTTRLYGVYVCVALRTMVVLRPPWMIVALLVLLTGRQTLAAGGTYVYHGAQEETDDTNTTGKNWKTKTFCHIRASFRCVMVVI